MEFHLILVFAITVTLTIIFISDINPCSVCHPIHYYVCSHEPWTWVKYILILENYNDITFKPFVTSQDTCLKPKTYVTILCKFILI